MGHQDQELQKRRSQMEERKRNSVSYQLRQQQVELNQSELAKSAPMARFWHEGTRMLQTFGTFGKLPEDEDKAQNEEEDDLDGRSQAVRKEKTASENLQNAAMRGDLKKANAAINDGAVLQTKNNRGLTPLMLASCSSGKEATEVVRVLVSHKSDIGSTDYMGWTCLHHACRNGKTEAAKYLMERKADPLAKTQDLRTTLMLATVEGKMDLIKELLRLKEVRDHTADRDTLGVTALHCACKEDGQVEILKLLIEHNGKPNAKDVDGKTPLMWAAESGKLDLIKQLIKRGGDLDGKDKTSRTALMYACMGSYEGVSLWLLKKSADPLVRDFQGETPLSVANDMGLGEFKHTIKMRRQEAEDEGA